MQRQSNPALDLVEKKFKNRSPLICWKKTGLCIFYVNYAAFVTSVAQITYYSISRIIHLPAKSVKLGMRCFWPPLMGELNYDGKQAQVRGPLIAENTSPLLLVFLDQGNLSAFETFLHCLLIEGAMKKLPGNYKI